MQLLQNCKNRQNADRLLDRLPSEVMQDGEDDTGPKRPRFEAGTSVGHHAPFASASQAYEFQQQAAHEAMLFGGAWAGDFGYYAPGEVSLLLNLVRRSPAKSGLT